MQNLTQSESSLRTIPLGKLSPVAFIFCVGEYTNDETGGTSPEMEYEVYDKAAFDALVIPRATRCACCGHGLKYICVFKHDETGESFFVGRDCAAKIERLKFSPMVASGEGMGIALAERAACTARERAFIAAHPEAMKAVEWAHTGINSTARDIVTKIRRFGEPSEKQTAFLIKLHAEDAQRRATATATAPTGRQTVTGIIVSAKLATTDFGTRANIVVDIGGGVKVWGNGGTACMKPRGWNENDLIVTKGDRITFTASFEPSEKDPLFGFFKRPSKVTVTKSAINA